MSDVKNVDCVADSESTESLMAWAYSPEEAEALAQSEVQRTSIHDCRNDPNTAGWLKHWWIYSPFNNTDNLVMKMDTEAWSGLSQFQKSLWFVDEVEARWQLLQVAHPSIETRSLWWSKYAHGSFDAMAGKVATMLGLSLSESMGDSKQHAEVLGGDDYEKFKSWAYEQDQEYLKIADYSPEQLKLAKDVQWGQIHQTCAAARSSEAGTSSTLRAVSTATAQKRDGVLDICFATAALCLVFSVTVLLLLRQSRRGAKTASTCPLAATARLDSLSLAPGGGAI